MQWNKNVLFFVSNDPLRRRVSYVISKKKIKTDNISKIHDNISKNTHGGSTLVITKE